MSIAAPLLVISLIIYAGPVSYTHLDVYKRQMQVFSGYLSIWLS